MLFIECRRSSRLGTFYVSRDHGMVSNRSCFPYHGNGILLRTENFVPNNKLAAWSRGTTEVYDAEGLGFNSPTELGCL